MVNLSSAAARITEVISVRSPKRRIWSSQDSRRILHQVATCSENFVWEVLQDTLTPSLMCRLDFRGRPSSVGLRSLLILSTSRAVLVVGNILLPFGHSEITYPTICLIELAEAEGGWRAKRDKSTIAKSRILISARRWRSQARWWW